MSNAESPDGAVESKRKIRTVSHTLDADLAYRLRLFAFETRVSESAVVEHALGGFFSSASEEVLAGLLRDAGYGLRRSKA